MIKFLSIFKEKQENGVQYHVTVEGYSGGEYDLVFDKRMDAKSYKQILKKSQRKLQAKITRREYLDNYILEEKEVY